MSVVENKGLLVSMWRATNINDFLSNIFIRQSSKFFLFWLAGLNNQDIGVFLRTE